MYGLRQVEGFVAGNARMAKHLTEDCSGFDSNLKEYFWNDIESSCSLGGLLTNLHD